MLFQKVEGIAFVVIHRKKEEREKSNLVPTLRKGTAPASFQVLGIPHWFLSESPFLIYGLIVAANFVSTRFLRP